MATEISTVKERRELVDRVANSLTFQKSPRLREFLLYVAECTLDDRLEDVREQQIAANVFNRKADYNPGQDNIVRVGARSLRKRLEMYFEAEGKDEPVIIYMPKGSYSLSFEPRPASFEPEPPVEIAYPAEKPAPIPSRHYPWRTALLWGIIAGLIGVIAAQWELRSPEKTVARPVASAILPFSGLIEPARDTYIVTSDCALVLIEDLLRQQVTLDDYISGRYLADAGVPTSDPVKHALVLTLLKRRYTNAAETGVAARIIQRYSGISQRMMLRAGRGVQLSDFKNHHAILFGSPSSNPWDRLFSEKLNFQFEWDQVRRGMIRNRSPRPGEQAVYAMTTNPGDTGKAYAVVAFVPNATGSGNVLMIGGTTAEGTESAGEFITDEARTTAALKTLGIDPAGPPRYFEFLLEVKAIAGSGSVSRILSGRLVSDNK